MCLTLDHSHARNTSNPRYTQNLLSEVVSENQIPNDLMGLYNRKNQITASINSGNPEYNEFDYTHGDTFILTTDGVHDNLTDKEVYSKFVAAQRDGADPSKAIANEALRVSKQGSFRSKPDDITCMVVIENPNLIETHNSAVKSLVEIDSTRENSKLDELFEKLYARAL